MLYFARLPIGFIIRNEKPIEVPGELPIESTSASMSAGASERAHRFM